MADMDQDDQLVSVAVAGHASGVSERTVRRWVAAGHVPATAAPGGRLVRLVDVVAYAAHVERQRTTAGQVAAGRPVSAEVSGRPADSDRAVSGPSGSDFVAQLVATIQQQAEEIGVLRERLRTLDAVQVVSADTPPAPVAPLASESIPTPTARSRPRSLIGRIAAWVVEQRP